MDSSNAKFNYEKPSRHVPCTALRMDASAELGERTNDDTKTAPVRLRARSADPIDHWYWGQVAHDLDGFELTGDKTKLALLYDHTEPVGYALKKHVQVDKEYGLTVDGTLVSPRGESRATTLIDQMQAGIPFEASISFAGGNTQLELLSEGDEAEVNGKLMQGPGVIVRKWQLREVSIVTSGADSDTESALLSQSSEVSVTFTTPTEEETEMSENTSPVIEDEAPNAEAVEMTADHDSDEAVDQAAVESPNPGLRFIETFGEVPGAVYFTKGLDFESACLEHIEALTKENDELKSQLEVVTVAADSVDDACSFNDGDVEPKPTFSDLSRLKTRST